MAAAMTMALAMNAASADRPGADWLKPEQVIQKLTAKGYSNFSKIEADDGFWEVEAELNGVRYDIDVDPKTGEVVKSKRDN
jgi:hypothetical protein